MEELNESKPEAKSLFENAVEKTVDLSENKTLKAVGIWLAVIGGLSVLFSYFWGTTKDKRDSEIIQQANELGFGFKYYRGVIKDSKGNIITTASCKLNYSDPNGKLLPEPQKNDTTNMTGYYLFKIPINSQELILNVSKTPSDKGGLKQSIDETVTDVPQIIIYP
jgi:hypothetical protein